MLAAETMSPTAVLLTPRGRGAVATVRYDGPCERLDDHTDLFRAANGRRLVEQPIGRVIFGHWGTEPPEEIVASRLSETTVEFHCHGGEAAARRLLEGLAAVGCDVLPWPEWMARQTGRLAAECTEALTRTTTTRTAAIAFEQQSLLPQAIADLTARAERRDPDLLAQLDALLGWTAFGIHLTAPWSVVLAGRPNVGKSSLINALVGYARSIVYDRPGTTRDVVTARTALDGWPVELADTAGIRGEVDRLEAAGIERARQRLATADCRVLLVDRSRPPQDEDRALLAAWPEAIVVAHKCDLPDAWSTTLPAAAHAVSSVTGEGVQRLADEIIRRLVPQVPPAGTPVPLTPRQVEHLAESRAAAARGAYDACLESLMKCATRHEPPAIQDT